MHGATMKIVKLLFLFVLLVNNHAVSNCGYIYTLLKMEPIGWPETSARNYHCSPHNNPEDRTSHLLHGGSLKMRAR